MREKYALDWNIKCADMAKTLGLCFLLLLTVPVLLAAPRRGLNQRNETIETASNGLALERKDKKGTIRIAGPWHSDSALDRNIDPGEDSYVKKIISSNEGINFNKDMAEAGEVFDVNGIEDFYDKNAMITYEINGHEIPVHLRPKYTPQSKAMFPEYGKELPGAIGQTKNHLKPSDADIGHHLHEPEHNSRVTTFSGLSVNEMPEYKVHDSPTFDEKFSSGSDASSVHTLEGLRKIAALRRFLHFQKGISKSGDGSDLKLPWKTADSVGTSRPEGADRLSVEYTEADKIAEESSKLLPLAGKRPAPEYFHKNLKDDTDDIRDKLRDSSKAEEHEEDYVRHSKLTRGDRYDSANAERHHSTDSEPRFFSKETNPHTQSNDDSGLIRQKGRMEAPSLFQQLEAMHREKELASEVLDESPRRPLPVELHGVSDDGAASEKANTIDDYNPEKSKVKAKILYLLGELTNKLKGIEKPGDTQAAVAKSRDAQSGDRVDEEKSPSEVRYHGRMDDSIDDTSPSHSSEETDSFHDHLDQEKYEKGSEGKRRNSYDHDLGLSRHDEDSDYPSGKEEKNLKYHATEHRHHDLDSEDEKLPEVIEKYHQHDKPFIMNTANIDYLVPKTDDDDHVRHHQDWRNDIDKDSHHYSDEGEKLARFHHQRDEDDGRRKVSGVDESRFQAAGREASPGGREAGAAGREEEPADKAETHVSRFRSEDKDRGLEDDRRSERKTDSNDDVDQNPFHNHHQHVKDDEVVESLASADAAVKSRTTRPEQSEKAEAIEYPDYNEVKDAAIFEHNLLRKRYHAGTLEWSDQLSDRAQKCAETFAKDSGFSANNARRDPGVNIAVVKLNSPNVGKDATDVWANEVRNFDFKSPLVTKRNADFVQMMWKGERDFGMGVAKLKSGDGWIVTAVYDTPYQDHFKDLINNLESDTPMEDPYKDIAG